MLPAVDDGARDLGAGRVVGQARVARDAEAFARGGIDRHQRLTGLVVDVRELDELLLREALDLLAEAPEARQRAEAPEAAGKIGHVLGLDRTDDDLGAIGERHALATSVA